MCMPGRLDVNEQETTESSKTVNHESSQWTQFSLGFWKCSLHAYYSIQLFYGADCSGLPISRVFPVHSTLSCLPVGFGVCVGGERSSYIHRKEHPLLPNKYDCGFINCLILLVYLLDSWSKEYMTVLRETACNWHTKSFPIQWWWLFNRVSVWRRLGGPS